MTFSAEWTKQFTDPYAVLGVAVTADERRIAKRYRQVAKQLHPDQMMDADAEVREFANHILTRLVNPAYQRLKQEKGRAEVLATMRFKVRRLLREEKLEIKGTLAKQLLRADEAQVDILYEKALSDLSEVQYSSATAFAEQTQAIAELNLAYLRCKMGDTVIREKRTGLVAAGSVARPSEVTPTNKKPTPKEDAPSVNYAERHVIRAKTYIANKNYADAIQELRDAVRIQPENSDFHTMLGQAYLLQKMVGMAKVHIRQAIKLNPQNAIALKYAKQLELDISPVPEPPSARQNGHQNGHKKSGGLFSRFNHSRSGK
jgi:curved DNA-binding protein CbpA